MEACRPREPRRRSAARLVTALEGGTSIDATKETVAAFLERWIEYMQGQVAPRSLERYAEIARKNLTPLLGGLQLAKLKPEHISAAYAKALISGHRKTGRGLSPRTVNHMHRVLRQSLHQAVLWSAIPRNPADLVKPPRVERKQMMVLDTAGVADAIEDARSYTRSSRSCLASSAGCAAGR
jgi:site-specific recombinase XerC